MPNKKGSCKQNGEASLFGMPGFMEKCGAGPNSLSVGTSEGEEKVRGSQREREHAKQIIMCSWKPV